MLDNIISFVAHKSCILLCRWAKEAVSPSVVQAVMNAWEMERHHAAERHLYPEVIDVLTAIKRDHPDVIIGAVTDGRANPAFMTFTLAKYFDFCVSWEDEQGARRNFYKELSSVEGQVELSWIYKAALEKYQEFATAGSAFKKGGIPTGPGGSGPAPTVAELLEEKAWVHVGDDLAYDVGGSKSCGALTVLVELADKYGQTARQRFEANNEQPWWSVAPQEEIMARNVMNKLAESQVDARINFLTRLPETINELLVKDE